MAVVSLSLGQNPLTICTKRHQALCSQQNSQNVFQNSNFSPLSIVLGCWKLFRLLFASGQSFHLLPYFLRPHQVPPIASLILPSASLRSSQWTQHSVPQPNCSSSPADLIMHCLFPPRAPFCCPVAWPASIMRGEVVASSCVGSEACSLGSNPALSFLSCAALGKCLNFSELQFPCS